MKPTCYLWWHIQSECVFYYEFNCLLGFSEQRKNPPSMITFSFVNTLQWRHNEHNGVSIHQCLDCCSIVCSDADKRKHQNSTYLSFVWGSQRWPANSSHKGPVTRKIVPFDDVIMMLISTSLWLVMIDISWYFQERLKVIGSHGIEYICTIDASLLFTKKKHQIPSELY